MRRLVRWVLGWLFTPPTKLTSPPNPLSASREGEPKPLWVDAGLVGMKPEIGIMWQKYFPSVMEIYMVLPGISEDDARWIWNACQFDDPLSSMLAINDVARAMIGGVPITEIREHGLKRMLTPPEWERSR